MPYNWLSRRLICEFLDIHVIIILCILSNQLDNHVSWNIFGCNYIVVGDLLINTFLLQYALVKHIYCLYRLKNKEEIIKYVKISMCWLNIYIIVVPYILYFKFRLNIYIYIFDLKNPTGLLGDLRIWGRRNIVHPPSP